MHRVLPLPMHGRRPQLQPEEPQVFDDDKQVGPPSGDQRQATASSRSGGTLAVKSGLVHTSRDNFAVLVHVQARGMTDGEAASGDAPLDLVTVLDVSGSMTGAKLALLKQAVGFVIDNLRPQDRLSVVSISSGGRRVTRLLRMSGTGKATTKRGSNIAEGLRTAAKAIIQDAFAQCIGGLLTVVVQDARVAIACGHPGIRVCSIKSGRY
ncbi:unnamed protein product [Miscanthus lutarioriparius]|uniref:VWFA domain-containing protein n=1 Tax=Miscanthus lutarioriparius TaxID=422564 RepID=A0A811SGH8_9POAL|nr:unnamed protein product [Miscanthus lutarioriparius]